MVSPAMTEDTLRKCHDTLNAFAKFDKNWNGYGADPFNSTLLDKAKDIVSTLPYTPEIFPTARDSIQLEFSTDYGDYLEFEIFETHTLMYKHMIKGAITEKEISENEISDILDEFIASAG